jgi:hypothetical protein
MKLKIVKEDDYFYVVRGWWYADRYAEASGILWGGKLSWWNRDYIHRCIHRSLDDARKTVQNIKNFRTKSDPTRQVIETYDF